MRRYINLRTYIAIGLLFTFFFSTIGPAPLAQAQDLVLPQPGTMVNLSPVYAPPVLKGIKIHPNNPFKFEFILDKGGLPTRGLVQRNLSPRLWPSELALNVKALQGKNLNDDQALRSESTKLIKYFLASLTIPDKDLWVNLSPYEKERIIPGAFGHTEMGRDLLAEDYMLKQITASLIYPEGRTGKIFWQKIYAEAVKRFGTTNIPVNTFNKVWIIPEKAVIYENTKAGTAYIVESQLKVMLEKDYLAIAENKRQPGESPTRGLVQKNLSPSTLPNELALNTKALQGNPFSTNDILRQIVIPALTKEVNQGQNFAQLRQVYNSLILATWYKKKIKDSILAQVYEDKNKIKGTEYITSLFTQPSTRGLIQKNSETLSPSPQPSELPLNAKVTQRNKPNDVDFIYQNYLTAFKKGVFNYIKDTPSPNGVSILRRYFCGGTTFNSAMMSRAMTYSSTVPVSESGLIRLTVQFITAAAKKDLAMTTIRREMKVINMPKGIHAAPLNALNMIARQYRPAGIRIDLIKGKQSYPLDDLGNLFYANIRNNDVVDIEIIGAETAKAEIIFQQIEDILTGKRGENGNALISHILPQGAMPAGLDFISNVRGKVLKPVFVDLNMTYRKIVNPGNRSFSVLVGFPGADVINLWMSTGFTKAYWVYYPSDRYETEEAISKQDLINSLNNWNGLNINNSYFYEKKLLGYNTNLTADKNTVSHIMEELKAIGASSLRLDETKHRSLELFFRLPQKEVIKNKGDKIT